MNVVDVKAEVVRDSLHDLALARLGQDGSPDRRTRVGEDQRRSRRLENDDPSPLSEYATSGLIRHPAESFIGAS